MKIPVLVVLFLFVATLVPILAAADTPLMPASVAEAQNPLGFRVATHPDGYILARETRRSDGLLRLDAQRISAAGDLLDREPVHLTTFPQWTAWQLVSTDRQTIVLTWPGLIRFDEDLHRISEEDVPYDVRAAAGSGEQLLFVSRRREVIEACVREQSGRDLPCVPLFGTFRDVSVAAVATESGFVVAASSQEWNEIRAVTIDRSGAAGDIRIIAPETLEGLTLVNNGTRLLLLGQDAEGDLFGRILDANAEGRSDPFRVFQARALRTAAAGVPGGFLVAAEHGVRIGFVPETGGPVGLIGVLGAPGTAPAAASATSSGDALFAYRSDGVLTAKLIGPDLGTTTVDVAARELGEQTAAAAASLETLDLAAWIEWSGSRWEARATRIADGVALDVPALVLGEAAGPSEDASRVSVAAGSGEFLVVWNRGIRRVTADGALGAPIANASGRSVASDGRDFVVAGTPGSPLTLSRIPGGTDGPVEVVTFTNEVPFFRPAIAWGGDRYLVAGDDYRPCNTLCPGQPRNLSGLLLVRSLQPIGGSFKIFDGIGTLLTSDGEKFFVATSGSQWGSAGALVGRGGEVIATADLPGVRSPRSVWWDGERFALATESFVFEVNHALTIAAVRAVPTLLDGSPSVDLLRSGEVHRLLHADAPGSGPSGGVPRLELATMASPEVDLSVRVERIGTSESASHRLVVTNHSPTTAHDAVVLVPNWGPLVPVSDDCRSTNDQGRRCGTLTIPPGGRWILPLEKRNSSAPLDVFAAARERDSRPENNRATSIVEVPAGGRSRPVRR